MFKKTLPVFGAVCLFTILAFLLTDNSAAPPASTPSDSSDTSDKALQEKIAKLIVQLGADKFDDREAAQEELLDIGDDAREALENALKSSDPEIAFAAGRILRELGLLKFTIVATDQTGNPVVGTVITARIRWAGVDSTGARTSGEKNLEVKTDANGMCVLPPLEAQTAGIMLTINGYERIYLEPYRFQCGKMVLPIRFLKSGKIRCKIIDDKTNEPLADTDVYWDYQEKTRTDGAGEFEKDGVSPGLFRCNINIRNYVAASTEPTPVLVRPGETTQMEWRVVRKEYSKGTVSGTILMPDGKPLAETVVFIGWQSTKTDASGKFSIELPVGNRKLALRVHGYLSVDLKKDELKPTEQFTIPEPVTLSEGLSLKVRVVDESGRPVSGAAVISNGADRSYLILDENQLFIEPPDPIMQRLRESAGPYGEFNWPSHPDPLATFTDEKGEALIKGLASGDVNVVAVAKGYSQSEMKSAKIVKGGETPFVEVQVLKPADLFFAAIDEHTRARIEGLQINELNESRDAFSPGSIWVNRSGGGSGGHEGKIALYRRTPGEHALLFMAPGYIPKRVVKKVEPGRDIDETIVLTPAATGGLSGRIIPAEGSSLDDVGLVCLDLGNWLFPMPLEKACFLRIDRRGKFRVLSLPEGSHFIAVTNRSGNVLGVWRADVAKGKETRLDMALPRLGSISGTLVDEEGKPLSETILEITSETDVPLRLYESESRGIRAPIATDKEGKFRVSALPPGVCFIIQRGRGGYGSQIIASATVLSGKDTKVALKKQQAGMITAAVTDAQGTELQRQGMSIYPSLAGEWNSSPLAALSSCFFKDKMHRIEADFKPENLPPEKYLLATNFKQYDGDFIWTVEIKPGKPLGDVKIAYPASPQKVSGKIRNYEPATSAHYYWRRCILVIGENLMARITTSGDGSFKLRLPPGKYKLYILGPNLACANTRDSVKPLEIVVEEGKELSGIELEEK